MMGRSGLNVDMIVSDNVPDVQSGTMSWKEVELSGYSSCGRSSHEAEKRPRILALANENVQLNLTSTSTVTETAAATATFTVQVEIIKKYLKMVNSSHKIIQVSCTTAGFTFALPMC